MINLFIAVNLKIKKYKSNKLLYFLKDKQWGLFYYQFTLFLCYSVAVALFCIKR